MFDSSIGNNSNVAIINQNNMKTINIIVLAILTHIGFFLLLSTIGCILGNSYLECINSIGWFAGYTLTFGWIFDTMVCIEYYSRNREYFKKHLGA